MNRDFDALMEFLTRDRDPRIGLVVIITWLILMIWLALTCL